MNTHTRHKIAFSLILGGTLSVTLNPVIAAPPPDVALAISPTPMTIGATAALPNIMLMIDNSGSMDTNFTTSSTAITPKNMPTGTTSSCNNPLIGGATQNAPTTANMIVTSTGSPSFCVSSGNGSNLKPCGGTPITFASPSSGTGIKCFEDSITKYYKVVNFPTTTSTGTSIGTYSGAQLNWYFKTGTFAAGSLDAVSAGTPTSRLKMAKDAAINLVNSQVPPTGEKATVRLGLSTFDNPSYDNNHGGRLLVPMGDITSDTGTNSQVKKIKDAIGTSSLGTNNNSAGDDSYTGDIRPQFFTPLAETLADIGRYFTTGHTGTLTLYPDNINKTPAPASASIAEIFTSGSVNGLQGVTDSTPPPIQSACQRSAVIMITDGLPNKDREISTLLRNYTGDCGTDAKKAADSPAKCDATPTGDNAEDFSNDTPPTFAKHPMGIAPNGDVIPATTVCKKSGNTQSGANPANTKDYLNNIACKNGSKTGRVYEILGSDYLDDVAKALSEMDLRPDFPGGFRNNLTTYTIGIADPVLKTKSEDTNHNDKLDGDEDTNGNGVLDVGSILEDAAIEGKGNFAYADNYNELVAALNKMIDGFKKGVGSFSAIAANSTRLGADSAIFQAKYDTTDWTGDFIAFPLDQNGDALAPVWNAGMKIPAWDKTTSTSPRNIFTYSSSTKGISMNGTAAEICARLTAKQKKALDPAGTTDCADTALWRLDYLRGDFTHELVSATNQASYSTTNPDPRAGNTSPMFRNRARFYNDGTLKGPNLVGDTATHVYGELMKPDPWLLGDIVNSDGVYVSNEDYGYSVLADGDGGGTKYTKFLATKEGRRKMVYVGANDGFLHGFDARISSTDPEAGKEIIAYMPNTIFANDKLEKLSSPDYSHQYYVDGSPRVSDAYISVNGATGWHTVLVGTTGAGGHGVFALDVTDPGDSSTNTVNFSASNVLWEINTTDAPKASDLTNGNVLTIGTSGFAYNLGYTMSQPSIVRMNNGRFAAIVANGYESANKLGVLYIIDIENGEILATLDTKVKSHGLSTPIAVDVDGNGTADAIFAGDLQGNMWKFDVSDNKNINNWKIAYKTTTGEPAPLFTACSNSSSLDNCNLTRQPITSKPRLSKTGSAQDNNSGVMVYFGTGKYFEDTDNNVANTNTQAFYAIWDNCPLGTTCTATTGSTVAGVQKSSLLQQSIIAEVTASTAIPFDVRVTSDEAINYPTHKGWFINLAYPTDPTDKNNGERIIATPQLIDDRILFVTFIPNDTTTETTDACKSTSASWLMEFDALSGTRPKNPVLDITNNGTIDTVDVIKVTVGGKEISVPATSVKYPEAVADAPNLIEGEGKKHKEASTVSGEIKKIDNSSSPPSDKGAGRQSWRQL